MKPLLVAFFVLSHLVPAAAQAADPEGEWHMAARDYGNTRFSPLGEITPANLPKLSLAFTFSTGVLRGHEAAPVVADNTMFIVTPYPAPLLHDALFHAPPPPRSRSTVV